MTTDHTDDLSTAIDELSIILSMARDATPKVRKSGRRTTSASSPRALPAAEIAERAQKALAAVLRAS